jgi:hypothetical protein
MLNQAIVKASTMVAATLRSFPFPSASYFAADDNA